MPLAKLESLNDTCSWGLWEITETLEQLQQQLSLSEELEKFRLITHEEKIKEKIAARLVIKQLLENWKIPFLGTLCDPSGKPLLKGCAYNISLSHSHNMAVAIVRKNAEIGIDIELIKEKIVKIGPRVFRPEEMTQEEKNQEKLTVLWSMKEVLYKLNGQKGIDFKENLFIFPFNYQNSGGITTGRLRTNTGDQTFEIRYFRHKNHIVAFNI